MSTVEGTGSVVVVDDVVVDDELLVVDSIDASSPDDEQLAKPSSAPARSGGSRSR